MMRFVTIILVLVAVMSANGATVEEIRSMIDRGYYDTAAEAAREAIKTDNSLEGTLSALLGEALYLGGDRHGAETALKTATAKGVADGYRWLGRMAYDRYDLSSASANYSRYFELKNSVSKPISDEAMDEQSRIDLAKRYLDRVENIQVIDSLVVDRDDFFRNYRLPAQSGRLLDASGIPTDVDESDVGEMVFSNERGDWRMWARLDSLGKRRLVQSVLLNDGTWHKPEYVDDVLYIGNLDYPYMTSDGMTLYFASDGPGSLGGLDIFMATRDPSDDSYRVPQNIGMPYNSPYDDYMFAIDEVNNVGWWATDRNGFEDEVTIYVFIPNEIRQNYPSDTDDIKSLALLTDISITQDVEEDYNDILDIIRSIDPSSEMQTEDFRFLFPDGRVYTKWDDFENEDAVEMMEAYLESLEGLSETESRLKELRELYHSSRSTPVADEIIGLEKSVEAYYETLRKQRSEIIRAEM